MSKIKVLFIGKDQRVRRRETMLNSPPGVEFVSQKPISKMKKDYELFIKDLNKSGPIDKLRDLMNYNNYIPKKYLDNIDIIYSPGKIIFNRSPWIVEIDNVSVLAYYNLRLLKLFKPLIKNKLKSKYCKRIVCISEAAKKSVINFFDDKDISKKCVVVYPYVKLNEYKRKKHTSLRFLCSNTKFYMKGTLIVLRAFEKLSKKYKNIELWVVSNTPDNIRKDYSKNSRIKFFDAKFTKDELYSKIYCECDVFVQPTLQDSFGLVYPEVMASGMSIITTDLFAIPEFVIDNRNGFLIPSPFYMYDTENFQLKKEYFPYKYEDTENILYKPYNDDLSLLNAVQTKMELMILNPKKVNSMKNESLRLITKLFNETRRRNMLKKIFSEALHVRNKRHI